MATRLNRYRAAAPALVEQRQVPRHFVVITRATVRALGEEPGHAVLRDVSVFGCRLAAAPGHQTGDRVRLRLGGGMSMAATVVWADDDVIGCRFDEPIDNMVLRGLTLQAA